MREIDEGLEIKPCHGDTLGGQLRFEKGGLMDIEYHVESVGAQALHQHTGQPRTSTVTSDAQNR